MESVVLAVIENGVRFTESIELATYTRKQSNNEVLMYIPMMMIEYIFASVTHEWSRY